MNPLVGAWYAFYSGIGNDVPIYIVGLLPMFAVWYRKNECHWPHCHRLGHHPYQHYHFCKKHHPNVPTKITSEHIEYLKRQNEYER